MYFFNIETSVHVINFYWHILSIGIDSNSLKLNFKYLLLQDIFILMDVFNHIFKYRYMYTETKL